MRRMGILIFIGLITGLSACAHPPASTINGTLTAQDLGTSLSSRISTLHPKAQDFFYTPSTELERSFYQTGLYHHWQSYGKTNTPLSQEFKGYILLSDPYHRGLNRISFLLGSDCSNFVHRFFQMIGAEFRFMKTRHWIHLAKAKMGPQKTDYYAQQNKTDTPIDLKRCEWDQLMERFEWIKEISQIQEGDVIIYPKSEGVLGIKGHMGFVSKTHPLRILQSKYKVGITETELESSEYYILRWRGPIKKIQTTGIADLLSRNYPEYSMESCP
jgi:hypothetical protein